MASFTPLRSLGTLTVLFLLMILVPGAVLAWLSWQSTDSFADRARRHAIAATRRQARGLLEALPELKLQVEDSLRSLAETHASRVTEQLARVGLPGSLAAIPLPAGFELRVLDAGGRSILPPEPARRDPIGQ